jgi:hypothetical protein
MATKLIIQVMLVCMLATALGRLIAALILQAV